MASGRYHHGHLRSALLDAAEALIRERGLDGWSLREATARVGVSPSAAYHHFDSRDELVQALSDRVLAGLAERLARDADRAGSGLSRLVGLGQSYVGWALGDPAIAGLAFGRGTRAEPHAPVRPHPHDVLAAELDRLVDDGTLPEAARPGAEYVVWAGVHGLAVLFAGGHLRVDRPGEVDREVERLVRAVLAGLAQEGPASPPWPAVRDRRADRLAAGRGHGSSLAGVPQAAADPTERRP